MFDAGALKIDRKNAKPSTIIVPRAFVAITGAVQTGIIRRLLGPEEFDSGLAARFPFAMPEPRRARWHDDGMPDHVRDAWRNVLYNLRNLPLDGGTVGIPLEDGARSTCREVHDRLSDDQFDAEDEAVGAALAKHRGYVPRRALVLQLVSWASGEGGASDGVVGNVAMQRAVALVDWFVRESRRIYGVFGAESDRDEFTLMELIEDRGGRITPRELMHASRRYRSSSSVAKAALQAMVDDGVGSWIWPDGRTRTFTLHRGGNGNTSPAGASANGDSVTVTAHHNENGRTH